MDIPQPWVLSLDRTNWLFGEIDFNTLMLAVVHEIAYICEDREFIGQIWLTYLLIDPMIRFRIRIRETVLRSFLM